jgi:hypothetical protein
MANEEQPRWIYYPRLLIAGNQGIVHDINLPADFKELVPKFYQQNRKKDVEKYASDLMKLLDDSGKPTDIRLNWDDNLGLTNIGIGTQGGLDLEESLTPKFREHNLRFLNSFYGLAVATKYIYELLQSE